MTETERVTGELDTTRLRKVAEAATQAEWLAATENRRKDSTPLLGVASRRGQGAHGCIAVFAGSGDLIRDRNANAEHCATFDPPTVLALLDRLDAAEAALGRVRTVRDDLCAWDLVDMPVPDSVDVPDDYELAMNDAGRILAAALASTPAGGGR